MNMFSHEKRNIIGNFSQGEGGVDGVCPLDETLILIRRRVNLGRGYLFIRNSQMKALDSAHHHKPWPITKSGHLTNKHSGFKVSHAIPTHMYEQWLSMMCA